MSACARPSLVTWCARPACVGLECKSTQTTPIRTEIGSPPSAQLLLTSLPLPQFCSLFGFKTKLGQREGMLNDMSNMLQADGERAISALNHLNDLDAKLRFSRFADCEDNAINVLVSMRCKNSMNTTMATWIRMDSSLVVLSCNDSVHKAIENDRNESEACTNSACATCGTVTRQTVTRTNQFNNHRILLIQPSARHPIVAEVDEGCGDWQVYAGLLPEGRAFFRDGDAFQVYHLRARLPCGLISDAMKNSAEALCQNQTPILLFYVRAVLHAVEDGGQDNDDQNNAGPLPHSIQEYQEPEVDVPSVVRAPAPQGAQIPTLAQRLQHTLLGWLPDDELPTTVMLTRQDTGEMEAIVTHVNIARFKTDTMQELMHHVLAIDGLRFHRAGFEKGVFVNAVCTLDRQPAAVPRSSKKRERSEQSPPCTGPSPVGEAISQDDRAEAVNRWMHLPRFWRFVSTPAIRRQTWNDGLCSWTTTDNVDDYEGQSVAGARKTKKRKQEQTRSAALEMCTGRRFGAGGRGATRQRPGGRDAARLSPPRRASCPVVAPRPVHSSRQPPYPRNHTTRSLPSAAGISGGGHPAVPVSFTATTARESGSEESNLLLPLDRARLAKISHSMTVLKLSTAGMLFQLKLLERRLLPRTEIVRRDVLRLELEMETRPKPTSPTSRATVLLSPGDSDSESDDEPAPPATKPVELTTGAPPATAIEELNTATVPIPSPSTTTLPAPNLQQPRLLSSLLCLSTINPTSHIDLRPENTHPCGCVRTSLVAAPTPFRVSCGRRFGRQAKRPTGSAASGWAEAVITMTRITGRADFGHASLRTRFRVAGIYRPHVRVLEERSHIAGDRLVAITILRTGCRKVVLAVRKSHGLSNPLSEPPVIPRVYALRGAHDCHSICQPLLCALPTRSEVDPDESRGCICAASTFSKSSASQLPLPKAMVTAPTASALSWQQLRFNPDRIRRKNYPESLPRSVATEHYASIFLSRRHMQRRVASDVYFCPPLKADPRSLIAKRQRHGESSVKRL
ncbi:hypothetical protein FN846DRAFT_890908 [Sphaerosporella brunnea]|uniref:Uncharacterized protein n=1 Tax=Sphaerosporella brunnea TaxID=1250544 RepID=A0A5J5EU81_9PEZI|nr:hypothetical protein FN846DRAFT_890908 [Sphaerosporella brunnea]